MANTHRTILHQNVTMTESNWNITLSTNGQSTSKQNSLRRYFNETQITYIVDQ